MMVAPNIPNDGKLRMDLDEDDKVPSIDDLKVMILKAYPSLDISTIFFKFPMQK